MASKRDKRKAEKARSQRARSGIGRIVTHNPTGDSIFFGSEPNPREGRVLDGKPKAMFDIRTGGASTGFRFTRTIGIMPRSSKFDFPGTLIPVSHLRPLVQRLIERGRINTRDMDRTIGDLTDLTSRLIPASVGLEARYHDAILDHGSHFTPLIAIQERMGKCHDWAAVFTAMARVVGLEARIEGDPKFFEAYSESKRLSGHHVWPVVIKPSGERVRVHVPRTYVEIPAEVTSPADDTVDRRVRSGDHRLYKEYVPTRSVGVPDSLRVNRPDVFE